MKYCKRFCMYAALLMVMCSTWIEDGSAQTWMPDTVLRAKVLAQLQVGDSTITEITETNIATLTTLNAVGFGTNKISNLTGLEKATSLTTLRLQTNSISDISALAGLTSLTDLRLYSNNISDISALKNLSSLIQVWLQGNTNLSDISALSVKAKAGQPAKLSLNQVWLQGTKVTDISPLEGAFANHWSNGVLGMPNTLYATDTNIAILMSMISDGPQHFYFHSTQYINNFVQQSGIPLTADAWRELLPAAPPPPSPPSPEAPTAEEEPVETSRRRIIYECPVGWTRGSLFGKTKKALIYELKVDVDLTNPVSIYTLKSIAIYVHPDEGLETLDGWHLTTGTLYNHAHENRFHLTAENSVIDEQGFAHIENPDVTPIRMGTLGYIGQSLPSFDYRLYDAQGVRVDFGISCYKAGGLMWRLWNTKDPRVLRVLPFVESEGGLKEMMKDLDWNAFFYRSEWTAAVMPDLPVQNAPFAPSKPKVNVVGTWADLKKGKD